MLARLKRRPSSWTAHSHPERELEIVEPLPGQLVTAWASQVHALIERQAKEPAVTTRPALAKGDEVGNLVGETVA